jgi:hypothetical protein
MPGQKREKYGRPPHRTWAPRSRGSSQQREEGEESRPSSGVRHLLRLRCVIAGAKGGEEPDPDPAGRAAALAPAAAGGSLEMGSSRPSRLCAALEMGSSPRSSRPAQAGEQSTTARRTSVPQPPPVAAAHLPSPCRRAQKRNEQRGGAGEGGDAGQSDWVPLFGCLAPPAGSSCGGGGRWGGLRI